MSALSYTLRDGIAVIQMDDGKANALNPAMIEALDEALTRAEKEAKAIVLAGRPGRFSAGFDLRVMMADPKGAIDLVISGANMLLRLYEHPLPVVAACSGHAIAGGAVMLLCCDTRIGIEGDFKVGLNEVQIGMPMPAFINDLAKQRIARNKEIEAVLQATLYTPAQAAEVGYLDSVVAPEALEEAAFKKAKALAGLAPRAYASTKKLQRSAVAEAARAGLAADMKRVGADLTMG